MSTDSQLLDGYPRAGGHRKRRWAKGAAALLLLGALLWVGVLGLEYFRTGQPIATLPAMPGPLSKLLVEQPQFVALLDGIPDPMGVAVAPDGRVYVTSTGGDRTVHMFDRRGAAIGTFAPPDTASGARALVYPAVSPSGDVYVTDRGAGTIHRFSAEGQFISSIASPLGAGTVWNPLGLTFDEAGNLYVTEVTPGQHRVLVLDSSGALLRQFGKEGQAPGDFWFPNGIAVAEGRIYVADSNNGRIQTFDMDGTLLAMIGRGTAKGDLGMPRGLGVDLKNHLLFVVDTVSHSVSVYEISKPAAKFLQTFGEAGIASGEFQWPNGLATAPDRGVYVADRANNRVQIWKY